MVKGFSDNEVKNDVEIKELKKEKKGLAAFLKGKKFTYTLPCKKQINIFGSIVLGLNMILKQSSDCIRNSQTQDCKRLVSEIEKLQLIVFDQNKFKCQSSLLGLQSEIIEAYFFKKFSNNKKISLMIPYVIKNC